MWKLECLMWVSIQSWEGLKSLDRSFVWAGNSTEVFNPRTASSDLGEVESGRQQEGIYTELQEDVSRIRDPRLPSTHEYN